MQVLCALLVARASRRACSVWAAAMVGKAATMARPPSMPTIAFCRVMASSVQEFTFRMKKRLSERAGSTRNKELAVGKLPGSFN
jgi:hypothetical protein